MLNVYLLDVSSMPTDDFEKLYEHVSGVAFIADIKPEPKTLKAQYLRVFLEQNVRIDELLSGFRGVKYTDVTGTNLQNN